MATALQIIPPDVDSIVGAYPSIKVPALLIWGDRDRVSSPEDGRRLAEALPGSQLEVVPDCGHMPQDEHPEATLALVNRFLHGLDCPEACIPLSASPAAEGSGEGPGTGQPIRKGRTEIPDGSPRPSRAGRHYKAPQPAPWPRHAAGAHPSPTSGRIPRNATCRPVLPPR